MVQDGRESGPAPGTVVARVLCALECRHVLVNPGCCPPLPLPPPRSQGGRQSPAFIIGYNLSSWLHQAYVLVSLVLGGVGSFFSGSAATSNMAFGTLQQAAAARLGLPGPPMLMLQIVGE